MAEGGDQSNPPMNPELVQATGPVQATPENARIDFYRVPKIPNFFREDPTL